MEVVAYKDADDDDDNWEEVVDFMEGAIENAVSEQFWEAGMIMYILSNFLSQN